MSASPRNIVYRLACDPCQVIGRPDEVVPFDAPGVPLRVDDFLHAHIACAGGPRIVLLHEDQVDHDVPWPGWRPRPKLGPPLPGHAQPVVCPIEECGVLGTDNQTTPVVWKRTTSGDPFLFCRRCGFTWGPGADADRARALLRSLG